MIILRNMDELMAMVLPDDHIAAVHVCSCNPRGLSHYPKDWLVKELLQLNLGETYFILLRIPAHCAHSSVKHPTAPPPGIRKDSPRPYSQLNSGTVVLNPSLAISASIEHRLQTCPYVTGWVFPDQDLLSEHFKGKWIPLAWYYNALRSLYVVHPDLWADHEIRCLHYIFADKPWQSRITPQDLEPRFKVMNRWWWERFDQLGNVMAKKDIADWQFLRSSIQTNK